MVTSLDADIPPTNKFPLALILPSTVKASGGAVFPIPTLPSSVILIFSVRVPGEG